MPKHTAPAPTKALPEALKPLWEIQKARRAPKKEGYKPKAYNTPRRTTATRINRRKLIKESIKRKAADEE
jgi:hypothetical protein